MSFEVLKSKKDYDDNIDIENTLYYICNELKQYTLHNNYNNSHKLSENTFKQVRLDCDRSFGSDDNIDDEQEVIYQNELYHIIIDILSKDSSLHYYQGYHDIVALFLYMFTEYDTYNEKLYYKIVSNREELVNIIFNFTELYLIDFMKENINDTLLYLNYIPKILKKLDYKLYKTLTTCNSNNFKFTLSNIITLFNHDIENSKYHHKLLVLKYLVKTSNISFILILYSQLLVEVSNEIYTLFDENIEKNDDILIIQFKINNLINEYLNNLPPTKFEVLLNKTHSLMKLYKIQNIFKYSLKNKHLLTNFNFNTEKSALIKLSIVSVNLFMLAQMKTDPSPFAPFSTSPKSIITYAFSLFNIYKTISS